ncbi:2-aminoethylphosphonate transport system permease protein [Curtobacterium pusillum]|uniref:2-aminoethylphosphonate transport system permease protein n=1 Tax=Curtobacterium pusillum TaxID=69373 RepID=A0AAW3T532_9MICO|nr:2-aminoethylphosphonate transport system permease protein [Curtobacterium pusillum]
MTAATLARPTRSRAAAPAALGGVVAALVPLGVLLALGVYPLVLLLSNAVHDDLGAFDLARWGELFTNPVFLDVIWTTVRIGVTTTVGCVVLGTFLALVIAFVPFPGTGFVVGALNVAVSFPSFLITLALVFVWGDVGFVNGALAAIGVGPVHLLDGQWGVVLAEIVYFTPFVLRPVLGALEGVDRRQLEVAESLGAGSWRIVRTVVLPEVLPAIAAGGALVLMYSLNEFGIVLFTGAKDVQTLPTLVYGQAIGRGDYQTAAIAAVVNVAVSIGLYLLARRVLRGSAAARSPRRRSGVR